MDVLIWLNRETRVVPGGHQTQMDQTAAALMLRGHRVVVSDDRAESPADYDVVHGLGLDAEQAEVLRRAGTPFVLSTIWWPLSYRNGSQAPISLHKLRHQPRRLAAERYWRLTGRRERLPGAATKAVYAQAKVLLPNGPAEGRAVVQDLGVEVPQQSVPNAIDPAIYYPGHGARSDYILMVGRFEPHKNQLRTIEALRSQERPLVVVGFPHPHHPTYGEDCRRALRHGDVLYTSLDSEALVELYRRAAVHVLNSWFETTGLASLEAGACGAPLVSTSRGFALDYFGGSVAYCDPARKWDVIRAVREATRDGQAGLSATIRRRFTWQETARTTELAYEVAVGSADPATLCTELP